MTVSSDPVVDSRLCVGTWTRRLSPETHPWSCHPPWRSWWDCPTHEFIATHWVPTTSAGSHSSRTPPSWGCAWLAPPPPHVQCSDSTVLGSCPRCRTTRSPMPPCTRSPWWASLVPSPWRPGVSDHATTEWLMRRTPPSCRGRSPSDPTPTRTGHHSPARVGYAPRRCRGARSPSPPRIGGAARWGTTIVPLRVPPPARRSSRIGPSWAAPISGTNSVPGVGQRCTFAPAAWVHPSPSTRGHHSTLWWVIRCSPPRSRTRSSRTPCLRGLPIEYPLKPYPSTPTSCAWSISEWACWWCGTWQWWASRSTWVWNCPSVVAWGSSVVSAAATTRRRRLRICSPTPKRRGSCSTKWLGCAASSRLGPTTPPITVPVRSRSHWFGRQWEPPYCYLVAGEHDCTNRW